MKKLRDYLKQLQFDSGGSNLEERLYTSTINVGEAFYRIKSDGIKQIEVTKEEYRCLIQFFSSKLTWDWSSESIYGVKLFIKDMSMEKKETLELKIRVSDLEKKYGNIQSDSKKDK